MPGVNETRCQPGLSSRMGTMLPTVSLFPTWNQTPEPPLT